nr:MAG TPA: Protein of unknown function (DUF2846) [Bacteriophage sp.]
MKRLAALLLATSMLAGCSTTAITPDEASSKEPLIASTCPEVPSISKIVVVRDSGILNAAVAANVSLDGEPVGGLYPSQKFELCVDASKEHFINVYSGWTPTVTVNIYPNPNTKKIVRIGFTYAGITAIIDKIEPLQ